MMKHPIRSAIRRAAKALGVKTTYHVCATYTQDSHMGTTVIAMTATVTPWLHEDNYRELVDFMKASATRPVDTPCIASITKLGI